MPKDHQSGLLGERKAVGGGNSSYGVRGNGGAEKKNDVKSHARLLVHIPCPDGKNFGGKERGASRFPATGGSLYGGDLTRIKEEYKKPRKKRCRTQNLS